MVITRGILNLLEGSVNYGLLNGMCLAEIHWCAFNWGYFACGHIGGVCRGVVVGIHIKHHIHTWLRRVAVEVEIAVVGLIDDCLLVGCCLPNDVESVVAEQGISSCCCDCARESVVSIG